MLHAFSSSANISVTILLEKACPWKVDDAVFDG
jgi:hypothetical protein